MKWEAGKIEGSLVPRRYQVTERGGRPGREDGSHWLTHQRYQSSMEGTQVSISVLRILVGFLAAPWSLDLPFRPISESWGHPTGR